MMKVFFIIYVMSITGIILFHNPTLFSKDTLLEGVDFQKIPYPAIFYNAPISAGGEEKLYRGNKQRQGVFEVATISLPLHINKEIMPLNKGIHGASKSSPVVDETGIYVASDEGWLYHFDHTGKRLWRFHVDKAVNGIHSTPLVTTTSVIFGAYNGRLYSISKKSGDVEWAIELGDVIGSSPVKDSQGSIYIAVEKNIPYDGYLVKLDPKGRVIWISEKVGEQPHSSPALSEDESWVFFGANNGILSAVDAKSGKLAWKYQTQGPIKSTPAVSGDRVLVTDRGMGHLSALDIKSGTLLWRLFLGKEGAHGSPVIIKDLNLAIVVSALGELMAIELSSGEIRWEKKISERPYKMSPVAIKTKNKINLKLAWSVVAYCEVQKLCFYSAQEGKILQKIKLSSKLTGEVQFYNNKGYLALDSPGGLLVLTN